MPKSVDVNLGESDEWCFFTSRSMMRLKPAEMSTRRIIHAHKHQRRKIMIKMMTKFFMKNTPQKENKNRKSEMDIMDADYEEVE